MMNMDKPTRLDRIAESAFSMCPFKVEDALASVSVRVLQRMPTDGTDFGICVEFAEKMAMAAVRTGARYILITEFAPPAFCFVMSKIAATYGMRCYAVDSDGEFASPVLREQDIEEELTTGTTDLYNQIVSLHGVRSRQFAKAG